MVFGRVIATLLGAALHMPASGAELPHEPRRNEARVDTVVTAYYFHGVPYGVARDLGPDAVPRLAKFLGDEGMKSHWKNTVQILNYAGTPASFPILHDFIMDRFKGEIDQETYAAISAAIVTMGPLARISHQAFQFLTDGADPKSWASVRWKFRDSKSEERDIQLSRNCINALGSSGMEEADRTLTELVRTSAQNRYWARLHDIVEEAITFNRDVMKEGFDNHRKRRDESRGGKKRT